MKRQEEQRKEKEKMMLEKKMKEDEEMLKRIEDQYKKQLAYQDSQNKAELAKKKAENNLKEELERKSQQHQLDKAKAEIAQFVLNQGSTLNDLQHEYLSFMTQITSHSTESGNNLGELLMQAPEDVVNRIDYATNRLHSRAMAEIAALPTPSSGK